MRLFDTHSHTHTNASCPEAHFSLLTYLYLPFSTTSQRETLSEFNCANVRPVTPEVAPFDYGAWGHNDLFWTMCLVKLALARLRRAERIWGAQEVTWVLREKHVHKLAVIVIAAKHTVSHGGRVTARWKTRPVFWWADLLLTVRGGWGRRWGYTDGQTVQEGRGKVVGKAGSGRRTPRLHSPYENPLQLQQVEPHVCLPWEQDPRSEGLRRGVLFPWRDLFSEKLNGLECSPLTMSRTLYWLRNTTKGQNGLKIQRSTYDWASMGQAHSMDGIRECWWYDGDPFDFSRIFHWKLTWSGSGFKVVADRCMHQMKR